MKDYKLWDILLILNYILIYILQVNCDRNNIVFGKSIPSNQRLPVHEKNVHVCATGSVSPPFYSCYMKSSDLCRGHKVWQTGFSISDLFLVWNQFLPKALLQTPLLGEWGQNCPALYETARLISIHISRAYHHYDRCGNVTTLSGVTMIPHLLNKYQINMGFLHFHGIWYKNICTISNRCCEVIWF